LLTDENTENSEITDQSSIFEIKSSISEIKFFIKFFTEDNEKIFDPPDSMPESVRDKAKAKREVMKIPPS
jgi:rRNA maturation endonuclease Nob1